MTLSTLANMLLTRFHSRTEKRRSISRSQHSSDNEQKEFSSTRNSNPEHYELDYSSDADSADTNTSCLAKMTNCLQFGMNTGHSSSSSSAAGYGTPPRRNKRLAYNASQLNDINSTVQYTNDGIEHSKFTIDTIISARSSYKFDRFTSPDVTPYQTPQHSPRASMNNKHRAFTFDVSESISQHSIGLLTHAPQQPANNRRTRIVHLPVELHDIICSFLQFRDVCNFSLTCSELVELCNNKNQQSLTMLPYTPLDRGDGLGCELKIHAGKNVNAVVRNDWRIAYCAREAIYNRVYATTLFPLTTAPVSVVTAQVATILAMMCGNVRDVNCVEESLRWIVQLHDVYGEQLISPVCSDDTIKCIISMFKRYSTKPHIVQMTSKCVGILSTQEVNRPKMAEFNGVKHLLNCMNLYIGNVTVLANICWALVIIARPLGALEGSTFLHPAKQTTANIKHIVDEGGIDAIIQVIKTHKHSPHVLTKAYWCLVNLSIVAEHKQKAIELNAIELIIESLTLFPTHPHLQYRAAFALINLAIRPDVKERLRDLGGIELLVAGMKQFPRYRVYQKCACVVLRSICYGSPSNSQRLITLGGVELICNLVFRWRDNAEFVKLGLTTLECIEVPLAFLDRVEQRIGEIDGELEENPEIATVNAEQMTIRQLMAHTDEFEGYKIPALSSMLCGADDEFESGYTEQQVMEQEEQARRMFAQRSG